MSLFYCFLYNLDFIPNITITRLDIVGVNGSASNVIFNVHVSAHIPIDYMYVHYSIHVCSCRYLCQNYIEQSKLIFCRFLITKIKDHQLLTLFLFYSHILCLHIHTQGDGERVCDYTLHGISDDGSLSEIISEKRSGPLEDGENITYTLSADRYYSVYFKIKTSTGTFTTSNDSFSKNTHTHTHTHTQCEVLSSSWISCFVSICM